jgi:hypothetical protein
VRAPEQLSLDTAHGPAAGGGRFPVRRVVWHTLGLLLAGALAWLILRAYRQPDFIIDLVNLSLC